VLCCHQGSREGVPADPAWFMIIENGGYLGRAGLHRMIFSGVFERHPRLNVMFTEQNGDWWRQAMAEFDSLYLSYPDLHKDVPKKPSEYCRENVFIGASYLAPFEAKLAVEEGYATNVCWGRDFPHTEGTWKPFDVGEERMTHLSLRYALEGIDPENVRLMAGDNLIRAFGLDRQALTEVAERIKAPTYDDLAKPIAAIPEGAGWLSFRTVGAWG
jgi:predicted TIM-barrel fold metal-dependent hydrolase